ncbi:MAG TPA: DUF3299 domain-containing protein [Opitutaceae bacterium]|nr:DUF3299 domain-containing protein [Opitutaceae bacterium]
MRPARFFALAAAIFGGIGAAWGAGASTPITPLPPQAPVGPMPTTPPPVVNGYLKVGFDRLGAFPFITRDPADNPGAPPDTGESQIPEVIKKLNGKKVIVTGFILPVKEDNGVMTQFLLMRDRQMCCYGFIPAVNQWILVTMPKGAAPTMDVPVSFRGTLHVGAMFEQGYMTAIYALDGETKVGDDGR